ncbi:unnamed protein product [Ranitomeya imitator]|uniref:Uncharacterized protein n=1 Tax=Ranitomeya imitator TaxID=111125 RepID=A0ABN9MLN8_9NEOB|nr:unnamed protein product [Ranitomeya imitator]
METSDSGIRYRKSIGTLYRNSDTANFSRYPIFAVPPSRGHRSRPYRGGYHDHREHDRYESYHNNACHDRNYNDNQYVDYEERAYSEYHERKQSYNEYREHREPVYNRGVRHDGGYHKETYYHDSYQRGHGEPVRYRGSVPEAPHKKYPHKSVKL